MVDESVTFGLSTLGTVVGIVIMLYGVSLTAGQELTAPMVVGGVMVLGAISLHTLGLTRLEDGRDVA